MVRSGCCFPSGLQRITERDRTFPEAEQLDRFAIMALDYDSSPHVAFSVGNVFERDSDNAVQVDGSLPAWVGDHHALRLFILRVVGS